MGAFAAALRQGGLDSPPEGATLQGMRSWFVNRPVAAVVFLLGSGLCEGCFATIEQVNPATGQPVWSQPGRAYFVRKRAGSTKVLACDAQATAVTCFETDRAAPQ